MPVFLGTDFRLQSAVALATAVIRLRFTQDPKVEDEEGVDDALNPANYTLAGPAFNYITEVVAVEDDLQAVDLFCAAPLAIGSWTLTVDAAVESADSDPIESPLVLGFEVTTLITQSSLANGASNDSVTNVLRKFFNPALKGPNWDSVLAGLAAGDAFNWDNAKRAFDQLFLASASGKYLDKRASDQGQRRPENIGMPDELFRQLVVAGKKSKLTQEAILEVLEVFYGADAVRASITSLGANEFSLEDEDELELVLDDAEIVLRFEREEFSKIDEATPLEVAVSISRQLRQQGSDGWAEVVLTEDDGDEVIKIYSGRRGLSSNIKVVGGKAQRRLRFPTIMFTDGAGPWATWDVTVSTSTPGYLRFQVDGASAVYSLAEVLAGDRVLIFGEEFNEDNRGSFEIKNVSWSYSGVTLIQYFEIDNPGGVAEANIVQAAFDSLMFHRPTRKSIYDDARHVIVGESDETIDIIMPATSQAVGRRVGTGSYMNLRDPLTPADSSGVIRGYDPVYGGWHVAVNTAASHGLVAGDMILVEGVHPKIVAPADVPVVAGTPTGVEP